MRDLALSPEALATECQKLNAPPTVEALREALGELHKEVACLEGVEPGAVQRYNALKEEIRAATDEVKQLEATARRRRTDIDHIKARWLTKLSELVRWLEKRFKVCLIKSLSM